MEEHPAGELHRVESTHAVPASTCGYEVHKVAARTVADEDYTGEVGCLPETLHRCRISDVLAARDVVELEKRVVAGVDGSWKAVLGREREVDRGNAGDF